jgi:hypothetical protein
VWVFGEPAVLAVLCNSNHFDSSSVRQLVMTADCIGWGTKDSASKLSIYDGNARRIHIVVPGKIPP